MFLKEKMGIFFMGDAKIPLNQGDLCTFLDVALNGDVLKDILKCFPEIGPKLKLIVMKRWHLILTTKFQDSFRKATRELYI